MTTSTIVCARCLQPIADRSTYIPGALGPLHPWCWEASQRPNNHDLEAVLREARPYVQSVYHQLAFTNHRHVPAGVLARIDAALSASSGEATVSQASRDVLAERERQKSVEGWTEAHDDEHDRGEMARAAACYALSSCMRLMPERLQDHAMVFWPWDWSWWKPKDPRRDMVRSAALIIADIERWDRASTRANSAHVRQDAASGKAKKPVIYERDGVFDDYQGPDNPATSGEAGGPRR